MLKTGSKYESRRRDYWRKFEFHCLALIKSPLLTVVPEQWYNNGSGEFMQIKVPEDTQQLSLAAGFANVDQFVNSLLRKERERLAIQAGIDAMDARQVTDFADFDREFRGKNGLKSR